MSVLRSVLHWRCPFTMIVTYRNGNPVASRLPHDRWAVVQCERRLLHAGHHNF